MGDCADSSSSLSALSCCTGAHPWTSAFCTHGCVDDGAARGGDGRIRSTPGVFEVVRTVTRATIQSARENTRTDTTRGVFSPSDTIVFPTARVTASATRSSVRRQERRLDMVVGDGRSDRGGAPVARGLYERLPASRSASWCVDACPAPVHPLRCHASTGADCAHHAVTTIHFSLTATAMSAYPTKEEAVVVAAAEKLMVDTMARYDPSHDADRKSVV